MSKRKGEPQNAINAKRPCASSALDFSTLPYLQSAVENSQIVEHSCLTVLPSSDENFLEFRIDKTDSYTDLDRTWLYVQVQVLNKDGTNLEGTDSCTVINNIGYSLFSSVDVFISNTRVTKSETFYPWWTYVYNLLFYSQSASDRYLEHGNLWYLDEPGRLDKIDLLASETNKGMKYRQSTCGDSKKFWLCTKLLLNTQLTRLIPSHTEIVLKFNRAPTGLCLLASKDKSYQIRIVDAKLHVNRVKLYESAHRDFEKILSSKGFFYPGTNPVVRTKTISKGDQNMDWTPFTGKLPQRIYMWMIAQEAYNGQQDKNPFNFQQFGITKLQVFLNGRSLPYSQGLTLLDGGDYTKFYLTTLTSINSPETFKISYSDFGLGYFIVAVDVSSDFSAGCDYDNIDEIGSLRITADFKDALANPITFFCLGEVQETLKLDGNRNPTFF
jgi:hypothetical protein